MKKETCAAVIMKKHLQNVTKDISATENLHIKYPLIHRVATKKYFREYDLQ